MLEIVQQTNDLDDYLKVLFEGETGYVYCATGDPTLDLEDKDYWKKVYFEWPSDKELIKAFVARESIAKNVYIAPALFSAPKSRKEFVKGSFVAWVDFDGHLPDNLDGIPAPSLVVESSDPQNKKQHWYWRLENFQTDIKSIERLNRGLAYKLDADVSGWDANQVLRPPMSRNHKYGNPQPVSLLSVTPYAVNSTAFGSIPEAPTIPVEFNVSDLLDQALIVASYQWSKQAFNLYRTLKPKDRSAALMQLAYFGAEMGMQDAEIFTLLYQADSRWRKFAGRPDRVRRLNDIIAKARIKHPYSFETHATDLKVFGLRDFLATEIHVEWVVPNFLESSGQMLLTAKPGIGKSRFTLAFFVHMALGKKFLHYDISQTQKLIYFSLEMGHAQLLYFLEKMAKSLTPDELEMLQTNLLVVPLGEALYLDRRAGQSMVEKVLTDHDPDGYAFDSLSRTTPETVNDEAGIKLILDWDAATRNRRNMFSWYIHHNRKATTGNKKPKSLDDVLGATVIAANTTGVYTLWSNDPQNKSLDVICVKQRLAEMEKTYIVSSNSDMTYGERSVLGDESFEISPDDALGLGGSSAPGMGEQPPDPSFKPNLGF